MARKSKGRKRSETMSGKSLDLNEWKRTSDNTDEDNTRLVDQALLSKLLYNRLSYVTPEDIDGVQRAYINQNDDDILNNTLSGLSTGSSLANYGADPMIIADLDNPFQLIPKNNADDMPTGAMGGVKMTLLRQLLRKIVDEV